MRAFEFNTYKQLIRETLDFKREKLGRQFSLKSLADYCQVQSSYLSRVLSSHGHLNEDQLYLACEFLELNKSEKKLALLLHTRDRSGLAIRQEKIDCQIEALKSQVLRSENLLENPMITTSHLHQEYYLDYKLPLIHMHLLINKFRLNPIKLCSHLGLEKEEFDSGLSTLQDMGLIIKKGLHWQVTKKSMHLPNGSSLEKNYQKEQRLRTITRIGKQKTNDYFYTVSFVADKSTKEKIKQKFLSALSEIEKIVLPADSKEGYQMNFDLHGLID